jgi:hypothetical protein
MIEGVLYLVGLIGVVPLTVGGYVAWANRKDRRR